MELWIPITLMAAVAQTARFGLQRQLKTTRLSSLGATFARYVYSAPLVVVLLLAYRASIADPWPVMTWTFWGYVILGGGMQILATICVMMLFARRNFSVGIAFTKTTVLMSVPVGWIMLGDTTSVLGLIAIFVGFVGVVILSHVPTDIAGEGILRRFVNVAMAIGLLAGVLFAIAGVAYRGAVLELPSGDPLLRAGLTLACATVLQTIAMAAWMAWREVGEISRVFAAWRIAGLVGFASMIGSICWFVAFSMQNVAYVNAVGQIELILSLALTVFVFKESISQREWIGGALLMVSILALILVA